MTVEVRDPRFREVVGNDLPVERHLVFTDIPG